MKKLGCAIAIQIAIIFGCNAQYNNIWMIGINYGVGFPQGGIDFTSGNPDTFSLYRDMPFLLTNSSICDSSGQLLFYSNGIYIANKFHDTLENSQNFNPGYYTTLKSIWGLNIDQAVVILPYPGNSSKYIVFHTSGDTITLPNGSKKAVTLSLRYSVIDMTLDSSKGGVLTNKKGVVLVNDTLILGKLNACKHGNGRDWWIIAQRFNDSLFYKILVTPDTIQVFTQQTGTAVFYNAVGQSVFSPDGSKYAMLTQNHSLDIFDFDRCDGMLSNFHHVNITDTAYGYGGAAISPDGHYLYFNTELYIYQLDLTSSNIDSTIQIVAINDSFPAPTWAYFEQSSLANDGKIYISTFNGCNVLHVVSEPDSAGLGSSVMQHSIDLPVFNTCIPVFPNYNLGRLQGSPCDTLQWAGMQEHEGINDFKIYPNPLTRNTLSIGYQLPQNKSGTFKIYDVTGKIVFKYNLPQWSTLQKFNLPELSNGVYSCVITSGTYRVSKKMVVIKE